MAGEHSPRKALLDRALRLFQQGYERQMSGELDEAAALYEASIGLFPTAEAHTFLAWTYSFRGRRPALPRAPRGAYNQRDSPPSAGKDGTVGSWLQDRPHRR